MAPEPQYLQVREQSRGRSSSQGRGIRSNESRSASLRNREARTEIDKSFKQKPSSNPLYDHVQPKLYNATVSHDIKQTMNIGRPPTTNKAQEILQQANNTFQRDHSFKPKINQTYKSKEIPKDERLKKLYQPRTEKLQERDM